MKKYLSTLIVLTVVCLVASCSTTQCKRKDKVPAMPNTSNVDEELNIKASGKKPKTVFVFKSDGSLQCGMGQRVPLKEMAKELGDIKIYSSSNKHDGMMHIQVCGSSTGQVNIYEIAEANLKQAISRGFKPWRY